MWSIQAPFAFWLQAEGTAGGGAYLYAVLGISVLGIIAAAALARSIIRHDVSHRAGTPQMLKISDAIKKGAEAFMRRQNRTILLLALVLAVVIFVSYSMSAGGVALATRMTVSFALGAICSTLAGFSGMWVSIRTNIRVASAARSSLSSALRVALRGGAVTGFSVVGLSLLGVASLFLVFGGLDNPTLVPSQIVAFGFGASFVALFAQLGGGIYTKAADVGADLVGKVEAGIPEDDHRNPAVIADLVGDNVGDCAGRGADLFESTAAENIGAIILAAGLYPAFGIKGILFPLVAGALGLLASIAGVFAVKGHEDEDPMHALNRGFYVTVALATVGFGAAVYLLLNGNWNYFFAGLLGIATSFLFVFITQYYTECQYRPVQDIAKACRTGAATAIISGLAVGMECVAAPVLVIVAAILGSYYLGAHAGITNVSTHAAGLFGTAVATIGMLSTAGYILAMDTFGPITDNAGGIVEMSHAAITDRELSAESDLVRARTDRLDAVGNTTKALTKGYAVGSAALAAFLLFSAYIDEVKKLLHLPPEAGFPIDLGQVSVFAGALLGAMLVFLFSSFAIKAVGNSAQTIIEEVRRQFKADPGIMAGTSDPDYGACVDIVTRSALKEMIVPGLLAVASPVVVGVVFRQFNSGATAVAAFLMVGTIAGVLMAMLMNNSGGAWDNAKKFIEMGNYGGKGSEAHKAAVVGDTVGDPFKDTAGPSLHVLIKLLSTITLVAAPLFL
jgi:K(+)-stimulated pyrophosphate-energized sodium pump